MKSYESWIILQNWKKQFTVKEFISTFQSPDPNKILFDMTKRGFLEKVGWGKYKVVHPTEFFKKKTNISEAYELVKKSRLKYAFTGADSVFLWTKGGYQVGRFFGFYPIYLRVLKSDLSKWKKILKPIYLEGRPQRTFFGVFYVLYPEADFKVVKEGGFFVDSLKQTVKFCKDRIYQYEPALEMLNEMYGLGMKVRYREA